MGELLATRGVAELHAVAASVFWTTRQAAGVDNAADVEVDALHAAAPAPRAAAVAATTAARRTSDFVMGRTVRRPRAGLRDGEHTAA